MSHSKEKAITRRRFLARSGQGLVATNALGTLLAARASAQQVPEPPGKKLGWAIVGLGSLVEWREASALIPGVSPSL